MCQETISLIWEKKDKALKSVEVDEERKLKKKKELLGPGSSLVVEGEAGTKPQELLRFLSLEVRVWYSVWPFG